MSAVENFNEIVFRMFQSITSETGWVVEVCLGHAISPTTLLNPPTLLLLPVQFEYSTNNACHACAAITNVLQPNPPAADEIQESDYDLEPDAQIMQLRCSRFGRNAEELKAQVLGEDGEPRQWELLADLTNAAKIERVLKMNRGAGGNIN